MAALSVEPAYASLTVEPACAFNLLIGWGEGEERRGEELEKNIVYKEISHYICHYAKVRCEAAFPPGQGPAGLA